MGTWTLKYTTGYNANTWNSKAFATYTAGNSNEEITSISAYFGVAKKGIVYNANATVTGDGNPCNLTMFSGDSTATLSITAECDRTKHSQGYYYPNWPDTVLYTWIFSSPISVAANSTVTIYCKKESGVLCNGNGDSRRGNVTGVTGVPKRYITYNANGGENAPSKQECIKGATAEISAGKPTKAPESLSGYEIIFNSNGGSVVSPSSITSTRTKSYTFSNWNTNANNTGTSYDPGDSITLTDDITLYAIYKYSIANNTITTPIATRNDDDIKLTVIFNGNGGIPDKTSDNSTASVIYTAMGWYTAIDGGIQRANNGGIYAPNNAETLYQRWESSIGAYSAITLPSAMRPGYHIKGWATSSTSTTNIYKVGASYIPSSSTTLYAIWESEQYPVSYNSNGGTGVMEDDTAIYNTIFTPKENSFVKYGYDFNGWNEEPDGSGVFWKTPQTWTHTKGITLYAQWKPWTYTILYDGNGAPDGVMNSSTHKYEDKSKLDKRLYSYPGYHFTGWSNTNNGEIICGDRGLAPYNLVTKPNDIITLYAIWSQNSPWTLTQIKIYATNDKWWTC